MAFNRLHDVCEFYLTIPGQGYFQAYPANESVEFEFEKEDEQHFYRKHLTTELKFVNDNLRSIDDFDKLYTWTRSGDKCEKVTLEVKRFCGTWSVFYNGYLSLVDMDIDVSNCTITVKPRTEDEFTCFLEQGKKEVNLLDTFSDAYVNVFYGEIQTLECLADYIESREPPCSDYMDPSWYVDSCLPSGEEDTYAMIEHEVDISSAGIPGDPYDYAIALRTVWAREFAAVGSPPSGSGWVAVTGGYARPAQKVLVSQTTCSIIYRVPFWDSDVGEYTIDNGVTIRDAMFFIADKCDLEFASDFFDLWAVGDAPNNVAYQAASAAYLSACAFFHITDVARPETDENASIMNITPLGFLNDLSKMFNGGWTILDGKLRFEHVSFFKGEYMLDLTQTDAKQFITGRFRYKYKSNELPQKEAFYWPFETDGEGGDFDGLPIEYEGACVGPEQTERDYPVDQIVTNVDFIQQNASDFEDSNEIVMIHIYLELIVRDTGLLSGESRLNGHLSWANLMYNYHRYNRPASKGVMNGEETDFFYKAKTRQQKNIEVPLTCANAGVFDAKDLVKTQLGWGSVETATLKLPGNLLKLTLIHE